MNASSAVRVLLTAALVLTFCPLAAGHGFLAVPVSRNLIANQQGTEFCYHCLSAGGPGVISGLTPGGKYPAVETVATSVRHTMCGEAATIPASQRKYNPSPVPSLSSLPVYQPGQEFEMTVQITAHHRGHFEFRLCDAAKLSDPTTVTWACLSEHVLQRVSVPGEVSPVDVNHPDRYYLEPECAPGYNKTVFMKYRMPSTVTCERCVLQWWWITGNTCNPPGYANRTPQPAHVASGCNWWQNDLPACGTAYPEEFWNCADVRILGAAGTTPAVVRSDPPAPRPAPHAPPTAPKPAPKAAPAHPVPKAPAPKAPAPRASPAPTCAGEGYQCGGSGWTGTTCCASGLKCYAYLDTYSQCRTSCPIGWLCSAAPNAPAHPAPKAPAHPAPKAPAHPAPKAPAHPAPKAAPAHPAPKAPAPKAPAPRASPAPTCAGNGYQCGGSGWTGTTCCASGLKCYAYIDTYSQCRTSCPIGWLCYAEKSESLLTSAVDWVKSALA